MPATGFAVTVRKSETIDLSITIDQAIQFIVSCGVVAPAYSWDADRNKIAAYVTESIAHHQASTENGNGLAGPSAIESKPRT